MNMYTFSTLNDKDFEVIVKDLLNKKFGLNLQSFKVGKDQGRDLRFSTPENNNAIIVQAKHYVGSGYAQLKSTLKNTELPKIKKLNPDHYIIATSLPLSASQKDELKGILSPFVLTSNDIIGQEDLNGYLNEHPDVEKVHYKLWFSSTRVLESLMNKAVEGKSRFLFEQIKAKIPFYVVTEKVNDARSILQSQKILLVTGQPGIGKTSLAEVLLFEWAKNGSKVHIVENFEEAERCKR